jgi:hypothetical protein
MLARTCAVCVCVWEVCACSSIERQHQCADQQSFVLRAYCSGREYVTWSKFALAANALIASAHSKCVYFSNCVYSKCTLANALVANAHSKCVQCNARNVAPYTTRHCAHRKLRALCITRHCAHRMLRALCIMCHYAHRILRTLCVTCRYVRRILRVITHTVYYTHRILRTSHIMCHLRQLANLTYVAYVILNRQQCLSEQATRVVMLPFAICCCKWHQKSWPEP